MKLPSFPRKALESNLDLYKGGELGKVITYFTNNRIITLITIFLLTVGIIRLGRTSQVHVGSFDC